MPGSARDEGGEIYLEFAPHGGYVKVTAIDAATGTEVCVVGAANAAQSDLERLAVRKLRQALKKSEPGTPGSDRGVIA